MYISHHALFTWVNCVPSLPQIKPAGCIAKLCAWVAMVSGRKEGTLAALSYMFVHWSRDERPLAKPRWSNWPLTFVLLKRVAFCTHLNRAAGKAAFGFWKLKPKVTLSDVRRRVHVPAGGALTCESARDWWVKPYYELIVFFFSFKKMWTKYPLHYWIT